MMACRGLAAQSWVFFLEWAEQFCFNIWLFILQTIKYAAFPFPYYFIFAPVVIRWVGVRNESISVVVIHSVHGCL